jgi:hypothetical protein
MSLLPEAEDGGNDEEHEEEGAAHHHQDGQDRRHRELPDLGSILGNRFGRNLRKKMILVKFKFVITSLYGFKIP